MKVEQVSAGYERTVISNVSLELRPGTITVLAGPNGSGKSTLLKTMAGLLKPMEGTITPPFSARNTAVVLQQGPIPNMAVGKLVLHGRFCYMKWPRSYQAEDRQKAADALRLLGIADLAQKNMMELSGGQQQKVWLAVAACQDTPEVLLDEPGTFMDRPGWLALKQILLTWKKQGRALLVVLHDLPEALEIADELLVLNHGTTVFQGSPEKFVQSRIPESVFGSKIEKITINGKCRYVYAQG